MDISLKDDNNAVDVSLDYEYDEFPLDYDEADDKHVSTTFRPVSAKETETDTASVPPASSVPLTSGVTCTTYRPRRTKVNIRNVRDWRADWQSDLQSDLEESASSWVNSGSFSDDDEDEE